MKTKVKVKEGFIYYRFKKVGEAILITGKHIFGGQPFEVDINSFEFKGQKNKVEIVEEKKDLPKTKEQKKKEKAEKKKLKKEKKKSESNNTGQGEDLFSDSGESGEQPAI